MLHGICAGHNFVVTFVLVTIRDVLYLICCRASSASRGFHTVFIVPSFFSWTDDHPKFYSNHSMPFVTCVFVCVCRVLNSWEYTSKPQAYVKHWPIGRQSKRTSIVQRKEIECYRYTKGIFKVCHPKKEEKRTIFYKCNRQRFRNHRGLFNGHKNYTNSTGNSSSWP